MNPRKSAGIFFCIALFCTTANVHGNDPLSMTSALDADGGLLLVPSSESDIGEPLVAGVRMSQGIEQGWRVFRAHVDNQTHTAHVAIDDESTHLAFDTAQKRFRRMLPSLRVELRDYATINEIVRKVGGTDGRVYEDLGFAIVRLPDTTNPARAAELLESQPGVLSTRLQLEEPPIIPM